MNSDMSDGMSGSAGVRQNMSVVVGVMFVGDVSGEAGFVRIAAVVVVALFCSFTSCFFGCGTMFVGGFV